MMNKGLLIFALLVSTAVFGQSEKQLNKIADGTCDCLKEKDLKGDDMDAVQMELGICMLGAMNDVGVKVDLSNPSGMEELGQKVGIKLAMSCPEFMTIIGGVAEEDPEAFNELVLDHLEGDSDEAIIEVSYGKVLEVTSDDFVVLKIENEEGKKERLYWFEHFEGADLLEDGGKAILKKNVLVSYEVIECYSPKLEDYTNLKVIRSLSFD